jgi:hypothetical protein
MTGLFSVELVQKTLVAFAAENNGRAVALQGMK